MRLSKTIGVQFILLGLRNFAQEIWIWFVHLAGCIKARRYRGARDVKLQFGCGPKAKPGWLNIDLFGQPDLRLDLRRPMPLPEGLCSFIYNEHFLEHLDYPVTVHQFLSECHRLLQPGGKLRIGVPDAEFPLVQYASKRGANATAITPWVGHPQWVRTNLDQIDFLFRMNYSESVHEHRHAWDFETLALRLRDAGFNTVTLSEFMPELDSEDRRWGTLYIEAVK